VPQVPVAPLVFAFPQNADLECAQLGKPAVPMELALIPRAPTCNVQVDIGVKVDFAT
jgi:hypothetical protein